MDELDRPEEKPSISRDAEYSLSCSEGASSAFRDVARASLLVIGGAQTPLSHKPLQTCQTLLECLNALIRTFGIYILTVAINRLIAM